MSIPDEHVPHEAAHADATDAQMRRTSDVGVLADIAVAAGDPPTKAEFDALVASHNSVLEVLRDSELIPTAP